MTKQNEFNREPIKTERRDVAIKDLTEQANIFSFRDPDHLTSKSVQSLMDSIREAGVLYTPLLVKKMPNGKYEVRDGHRRRLSCQGLVEDEASKDWTADTNVPVNVIINDVSLGEQLLASVSSNVDREELSKTERARAAYTLYTHAIPKSEIMRRLDMKETQLERDLLVGGTKWMMDLIVEKSIDQTRAAELLSVAHKKNCIDQFKEELELWVEEVKLKIKRLTREYKQKDRKVPQRLQTPAGHMDSKQIKEWKDAMEEGRDFEVPEFQYTAYVESENGVDKIKIEGLAANVAEMKLAEFQKVYERLLNVTQLMEPHLLKKLHDSGDKSTMGRKRSEEHLEKLGLSSVLPPPPTDGEDSETIDDTNERTETDATDTMKFPTDGDEATEDE